MSKTNAPSTPKHDDPARKKQEDKRPNTIAESPQGKKVTPDKAHDPQRNAK
ncbi:hypothetical protein LJ737_01385 [Hymenobacter sp. 15J16-1T3B]|uniref:hypothetical protein n=1 Tax=Hymenobacter sp. 15J16-1T3B TaxID=2886941 RepID=UPI001D112580|nr:hypothetical protein [Hymenobacter sp. 15J16-1T3B]MCC3155871.1 hypothetical protein [Hymenobacter sp. 15J16-1T3B]